MMRTQSGRRPPGRPTSARRSRCAGGSTAAATTAASCSSTSATPRGSSRSWSIPRPAGGDDAHRVRGECVLRVEGAVRPRPEGTVNADAARPARSRSAATALEVLNEAEPPPFPLDDRIDVDEVLRFRHRYLDLRRAPDAAQPPRCAPR